MHVPPFLHGFAGEHDSAELQNTLVKLCKHVFKLS